MNHLNLLILAFALLTLSCTPPDKETSEETSAPIINASSQQLPPKVTGIGGIFFQAEQPDSIKSWYGNNLGMAVDNFGAVFEFRNGNNPEEINYLRWSVFEENDEYIQPSNKPYMINYRVQNIEGLVAQLQDSNVTIVDEIVEYPYGKFVHIMDPEGTKIELWEPVDSVLTQMGGVTNK
ncbi:MAG: VOC family protein [Bacteroidota bacterium]